MCLKNNTLGFHLKVLDKYKFIELKANSKAVPEREGGKPQVWRKGFKAFSLVEKVLSKAKRMSGKSFNQSFNKTD